MNIFHNLFPFLGVLGKRMLNPEVLKCHEDLITLETYAQQGITMDNKFFICENFRAVRPHHRADICITRENKRPPGLIAPLLKF